MCAATSNNNTLSTSSSKPLKRWCSPGRGSTCKRLALYMYIRSDAKKYLVMATPWLHVTIMEGDHVRTFCLTRCGDAEMAPVNRGPNDTNEWTRRAQIRRATSRWTGNPQVWTAVRSLIADKCRKRRLTRLTIYLSDLADLAHKLAPGQRDTLCWPVLPRSVYGFGGADLRVRIRPGSGCGQHIF
jgi:hypothetical protein